MVENSMADGVGLPRANENSSIACQTSLTANIGFNGSFAEVSNLKNDAPAVKADAGLTTAEISELWSRASMGWPKHISLKDAVGDFALAIEDRVMDRVRAASSPPAPMPAVDEAKDSLLKRLAEFVGLAFDASFDGCDLDGGTIQDFGVRCGLLVNVEFDPEKHDDGGIGLEPGDDFFEYAPDFRTALTPPSSAPASEGDKT